MRLLLVVCSGISAEDQAKLFEPYSFVTSGWVEKSGVSGLGLSMAKRYVEKVGGNIGVKSSLGKGSTFFFSIPFPLVPRNDNNKPEVLQSNLGALPQYAPETTRIYDVSITQKSISRRQKSMELQLKLVKKESATKPAEEKQKELAHKQRKVLLVEDTRINRVGLLSYTYCGDGKFTHGLWISAVFHWLCLLRIHNGWVASTHTVLLRCWFCR